MSNYLFSTKSCQIISAGDGEPDMDFPAIDKSMKLKAFNLNEFCLCAADDNALPPPPPLQNLGPIPTRPVSIRSAPLSQGSLAMSRRSPPPPMIVESFISEKSNHASGMLSRQESFVTVSKIVLFLFIRVYLFVLLDKRE